MKTTGFKVGKGIGQRIPFDNLPPGIEHPEMPELTWWRIDGPHLLGPWSATATNGLPEGAMPAITLYLEGRWWLCFGPWDGVARERFRVPAPF